MKKIEVIANITLIIIGLIFGTYFYFSGHKGAENISLIMFSIALASILYQFLGGIKEENSFQLGAIKFGGSVAVLIGFMFFFKKIVFTTADPQMVVSPNSNWIPINAETGRLIPLKISFGDSTIEYPSSNLKHQRKFHKFMLAEKTPDQFYVGIENYQGKNMDTIGFIELDDFNTKCLFNRTVSDPSPSEPVFPFKLIPEEEDRCSTEGDYFADELDFPFEIRTSKARFSIYYPKESETPFIKNAQLVRRSSFILPINTSEAYVIILEQANAKSTPEKKAFSKWLVKKIKYRLDDTENI